MLLSFVVPAYNEESYLADCLQSIVDQTAGMDSQVEVIVVNNASTDATGAVAARFPGVHVVDEARKGLTHARQAGLLASHGTLVANVDADSRLTPGWVSQVLSAFREDNDLVSFSGPLVYYDLNDRQRRWVKFFYATAWMTYACNRWVLGVGSMVQGGNFVVKRAALEQIGGYDTTITFYGEDTDIARRLHNIGKVRFTFDLKMFSSARRLKHEGMFTMAIKYSVNYMWTIFFKRPFSRQHVDVREDAMSEQPQG